MTSAIITIIIWLIVCYLWYRVGKNKGRHEAYLEMLTDIRKMTDDLEELHDNMHEALSDLEKEHKELNGTTRKPRSKTV